VHVLILTLVFPPDGVSTAHIVRDLADDLRACGHDVTVVTTTPHYNRDDVARAAQPLGPLWGGVLQRSEYHGLPVYHVLVPQKGGSVALRLLGWVWFHILATIAAVTVVPRANVILAPSPPLTIGLNAWVIGLLKRIPYIYNVQEIYPDIAVNLGALRNRALIRVLLGLERFVYDRAAAITVIAPAMRQRLEQKGVASGKLRVIPNAVDLDEFVPRPRENDFARRHGLERRFVVSYAGNMGPAQGLETILDAAALAADLPDLLILLVGGGILAERLAAIVEEKRLANVLMLPHQPYALVPQIYAASDVCLVPLAGGAGTTAIPSKVYRIMASGRPMIAPTDAESDLAALIAASGAGMRVAPGDAAELARTIRHAHAHRAEWTAMGAAGRAHVEQHYGRAQSRRGYDAAIRAVARP
jgi:colanic acid biosynthesis glycosyl transferase WcaI